VDFDNNVGTASSDMSTQMFMPLQSEGLQCHTIPWKKATFRKKNQKFSSVGMSELVIPKLGEFQLWFLRGPERNLESNSYSVSVRTGTTYSNGTQKF